MSDEVVIRDAATVVLVRDGADGVETLLLQRHGKAVFGPGAHVFPGGAVDAADGAPALIERCRGLDDAAASRALGLERGGLAFWVAAIRECFEEAGILIAVDAAGADLPAADPAWRRELAEQQRALNAGERSFAELCRAFDLYLPLERLHYYSHWITPKGPPRRFSTRFFATPAPAGVQIAADGAEITECEWVSARRALARRAAGGLPMMPPTEAQLRFLAESGDSAGFFAAVADIGSVPTVAPRMQLDKQGRLRRLVVDKHGG